MNHIKHFWRTGTRTLSSSARTRDKFNIVLIHVLPKLEPREAMWNRVTHVKVRACVTVDTSVRPQNKILVHLPPSPVSASWLPRRSLGTRRLCASPPGLGDRRLTPLQEPFQADCQWRRLHQSRWSTLKTTTSETIISEEHPYTLLSYVTYCHNSTTQTTTCNKSQQSIYLILQSSSREVASFPLRSVPARWLWQLHLFAASPFSSSPPPPSSSWTSPWSCRR